MDSKVPIEIRDLLEEFIKLLNTELYEEITGVYLYGSISLGEFDYFKSDIDFIVILKNKLDDYKLDKLEHIHSILNIRYEKAKKLDGLYINIDDIGKCNNDIDKYPYYHYGKFNKSGYWDNNKVTWWILKNKGIKLYGRNMKDLAFNVEWKEIQETMNYNLNNYWHERVKNVIALYEDEDFSDAVLTICRIIYSLKYKDITSKIKAAKEAKKIVNDKWHNLIDEAISIRNDEFVVSNFNTKEKRMAVLVDFILDVIIICNKVYFPKSNNN